MNPNILPNANSTVEHIRLNLNLAKSTMDLAHCLSLRAMEIGNAPAVRAIQTLLEKEKYFHERLNGFLNQAIGFLHTVSHFRDPRVSLNQLQNEVKAFDIDMANFYAGSEYQVAWEYLSQVKRAKAFHGPYMRPIPPLLPLPPLPRPA